MIVIYESNRLDRPFSIAKAITYSTSYVMAQRLIEHRPVDETNETFRIHKRNVIKLVPELHLEELRRIQENFSERYWGLQESKKYLIDYIKEKK